MKRTAIVAMGSVFALLLSTDGKAADHVDSPAAIADASADITDLYAWMSADASKLNLVMNVSPFAESTAVFSNAVQYVFHVNSATQFGAAGTETLIMCTFAPNQRIQCWAGDEYVTGDARTPAGLASASGKLRVFAGPRNDPFFFNRAGFLKVVETVTAALDAGTFTADANGCYDVDAGTSAALVQQLQEDANGNPATDSFGGANVLSLIVQVDKSVVTGGGPILGVWASTNASN